VTTCQCECSAHYALEIEHVAADKPKRSAGFGFEKAARDVKLDILAFVTSVAIDTTVTIATIVTIAGVMMLRMQVTRHSP
jgi:hypothetical protein